MLSYRDLLKLEKHVEGGYFGLFYQASDEVGVPDRYASKTDVGNQVKRKAGSSIYFMLEKNNFSAWHRLKSDEIWHYYDGGSPIDIHVIDPDGNYYVHALGNPAMDSKALFQVVIKAGCWFAAEVRDKNTFGLVGCTVSPGFEYHDFELADKTKLTSLFPQLNKVIEKFIAGSQISNEIGATYVATKETKLTFQSYKSLLKLEKHVEGGYFGLFYQASDEVVVSSRYASNTDRGNQIKRKAGSSIYFMLEKNDFSAWHRLKSDEIWHFYDGGSPIDIHVIDPDGNYHVHALGKPAMDSKALFQVALKAGCWFAAEVRDKNTFGLVGCTVSPGFEYHDFELADKIKLTSLFPRLNKVIEKFCRATNKSNYLTTSQLVSATAVLASGLGLYTLYQSDTVTTCVEALKSRLGF